MLAAAISSKKAVSPALLVLLLLLHTAAVVIVEGAYSVAGKTVLVTGSAGGIGKGIAKALAEKGAKIVVHYHTRETEALAFSRELGPERCLGALHCDFRNTSSIPSFFARAKDLSGKLDILVNNAGAITKLALEDDDEELTVWKDTMAVNLHAPNLLGKLFAEQFREGSEECTDASGGGGGGGGVILNVGSIHGDRSNEYMGAYAASKAALESLTRTQAIEYGPAYGVRANLIAPGIVPVERTEAFFRENPGVLKSWTDRMPLGKEGTVEQVAAASLAMIENEWANGAVWQIDGGMLARGNLPPRDRP
ncbi:unnamed protein product [Pseudo-nitzschia multistriata]|uniref:Uncharacterized protein n=1 Tax=Pseudo-nitzschia multistriata TaxID=183589 RepID=A0A448ZRF4_9STRA|nr:unnamed protein product [Pseudo-nitzschia multistriata]